MTATARTGNADGRIAVIGACYYTSPEAMNDFAKAFVGDLLPRDCTSQTRLVAMRPAQDIKTCSGDTWIHSTGNYLDISAFATGAAHIQKADAYVMFNDTLFTKHAWRQMGKRLQPLLATLAEHSAPAAAGEVHPSTDLILVDQKNPTRRHLSTFCTALNQAGFDLFRHIVATLPQQGTNDEMRQWLNDHCRSHVALKHLLHIHLLGPINPWTWKGKVKGNVPENLLLRKAIGVSVEYLLSERILSSGGVIMPVNTSLGYRIQSKAAELRARFQRS